MHPPIVIRGRFELADRQGRSLAWALAIVGEAASTATVRGQHLTEHNSAVDLGRSKDWPSQAMEFSYVSRLTICNQKK
jgi:hypothetical protein